jgi:hypothetical protein
LVQGLYSFQLTVTDNAGAIGRDTVNVTVNAAVNQAPTANAGNAVTIYLPQDSVHLFGAGIDADGLIAAYHWRIISSPGQYSFTTPDYLQTQLNNLEQGVYEVEFSVTDNNGAKGYDTILVTVGSSRQNNVIDEVNIYPNPVNSIFNAEIKSAENDKTIALVLYDSRGSKVYEKMITLIGNSKLESIDISNLKTGIYLLQINFGNKKQIVKKVIKI